MSVWLLVETLCLTIKQVTELFNCCPVAGGICGAVWFLSSHMPTWVCVVILSHRLMLLLSPFFSWLPTFLKSSYIKKCTIRHVRPVPSRAFGLLWLAFTNAYRCFFSPLCHYKLREDTVMWTLINILIRLYWYFYSYVSYVGCCIVLCCVCCLWVIYCTTNSGFLWTIKLILINHRASASHYWTH